MRAAYNDYTMWKALGSVSKEYRQMARLAVMIRQGNHPSSWQDSQESRFTGIYARLLTDPIEDVRKAAGLSRAEDW